MEPLTAHLARTLTEDRGRVLLDNAAGEGLRAAGYLRQNLGVKRRALELSLVELEDRVSKVRAQLAATRESLAKLHDKIYAEGEAVKAQLRNDLEHFVDRFEAALPLEIERADSSDVRRFLPLFIQDKFKEWAELEGEKAGAMLERLAEEPRGHQRNAREATAAVADRLGPGDARLEVDVDTFSTTCRVRGGRAGHRIFISSTTWSGPADPGGAILAIVFQSRIAAEIKEDARKKAPSCAQAAAIIGPQFPAGRQFVKRLSDFVTSWATSSTPHRRGADQPSATPRAGQRRREAGRGRRRADRRGRRGRGTARRAAREPLEPARHVSHGLLGPRLAAPRRALRGAAPRPAA